MTKDEEVKKLLEEDAKALDDSYDRVMSFFEDGPIEDETIIFEPDEPESMQPANIAYVSNNDDFGYSFKVSKPKITTSALDFLAQEEIHNLQRLDDNVRDILITADTEDLNPIDRAKVIMERVVDVPLFIRPNRDDKVFTRIIERTLRIHIAAGKGRKVRSDVLLAAWDLNEEYYRKVIKRLDLIIKLRELLSNE